MATNLTGTIYDSQRLTGTLLAVLNKGANPIGEYDSGTTYNINDLVGVSSVLGVFVCLQNNTLNKDPLTETDYWRAIVRIPNGGIVNTTPLNEATNDDICTFGGLFDYYTSIFLTKSTTELYYYLIKNLILAPADAWTSRKTNGARWQIDETATNKNNKGVMLFSTSTREAMQLELRNLNGELITRNLFKVKIHAKASTTVSGENIGVVWGIKAAIIARDLDQAFGNAVTIFQEISAVNTVISSDWSGDITIPEIPAVNQSLLIEIYRDIEDLRDVLNQDAAILDVEILLNQ